MTDAVFTPGPWFVVDQQHSPWTDALVIGTDPEGLTAVAHTTRGFECDANGDGCPSWANARLIAAAPDLYEALSMIRDADEDCKRDGLPTIPEIARAKIDAALARCSAQTQSTESPDASH